MNSKIISVFNHKGGVGKTTTVFNLGKIMANLGKRVLLVDSDPQCNLTNLTIGLDNLEKFYSSKKETNIFNCLATVFEIPGFFSNNSNEKYIKETKTKNMYLLAGNVRFSELDVMLSTALTSNKTLPILKKFIGSINKLIIDIVDKNKIDIVLIDMSPSISSTNACILMGSDYFIMPVSPDIFCCQAMAALSVIFSQWHKVFEQFRGSSVKSLLQKNPPKLIGMISQSYIFNSSSKKWFDRIIKVMNDVLIPELKKNNMVIDESIFSKVATENGSYNLINIPYIKSLETERFMTKNNKELSESIFTRLEEIISKLTA